MRVFLIVLDSLGIGAASDAALFGDAGSDTLKAVSASTFFSAPNMIEMGLGNIDRVDYLPKATAPTASYARLTPVSPNKDTTSGHWEIAGVIAEKFPTYPDGFPEKIISEFRAVTGRGVLCNKPYSGTEVIKVYGDEHLATGALIVYTSQDSVFQIAAHESIVPPDELYRYCAAARKILTGKHSVARIIARPFAGTSGAYYRTENRRDFSLAPPSHTLLDRLAAAGKDVIAVGKINDIFAGRGITRSVHAANNAEGIEALFSIAEEDFEGLCFVNLVDFDMLYGHRNDRDGYARAIAEFDSALPHLTKKLRPSDALILTADHGCDPSTPSTDHSREDVFALMYGKAFGKPSNLHTLKGFFNIGKAVARLFGIALG